MAGVQGELQRKEGLTEAGLAEARADMELAWSERGFQWATRSLHAQQLLTVMLSRQWGAIAPSGLTFTTRAGVPAGLPISDLLVIVHFHGRI